MSQKQKYLRENIIDEGYDPVEFSNYLMELKEEGMDINNWEIMELIAEVKKFKHKINIQNRKIKRN